MAICDANFYDDDKDHHRRIASFLLNPVPSLYSFKKDIRLKGFSHLSVFDPCQNFHCRHNGTCVVNRNATHGYTCTCQDEFTGDVCQCMYIKQDLHVTTKGTTIRWVHIASSRSIIRWVFKDKHGWKKPVASNGDATTI